VTRRFGRAKKFKLLSTLPNTERALEALRSLRTATYFGLMQSENNVVTITSSAPEEGKSFMAINFSDVCASAGAKVCVVDADLRRGYLRKYTDLTRGTKGLSEHLAGQIGLEEVKHVIKENLTLIPTGAYPPNPAELLMNDKFTELLDILRKQYDLVIIDTPPVLAVTDPIIVMRNAGVKLAVVRHQKTDLSAIEGLKNITDRGGVPIDGIIVNDFNHRVTRGYKTYAYTGRYEYRAKKS
jgi:tyrosine-protein kinase Etk/Wzc